VVLASGQTSPGSVLLSNAHAYWVEAPSSDSLAIIHRVPLAGGAVQNVISGQGRIDGFALGGNQIYFGAGDRRTADATRQVRRANLDGSGLQNFSPNDPDGVNGVLIDSGFVFYRIIIGINASNDIYRAPLLSQGQTGTGQPVLFATVAGPLLGMTAAGGCLYYVAQNSPAELMRKCSPTGAVTRQYLGAGRVGLSSSDTSYDATHLYFIDFSRGMLRLPLTSTTFELLVAGNINTAPEPNVPTVDGDRLYYFMQTGSLTAPACTNQHALFRSGKTLATAAPIEILPAPHQCPTRVAADATALYWSNAEGGTVVKLAK
jgi:hypothetical protein